MADVEGSDLTTPEEVLLELDVDTGVFGVFNVGTMLPPGPISIDAFGGYAQTSSSLSGSFEEFLAAQNRKC